MRKASVQLKTNHVDLSKLTYQGVINEHSITTIKATNNNHDKFKYGVVFSRNFMKLFNVDINIYSQELTHEIVKINSAVTQALVREVISHVKVNRSLDEILKSIGIKIPGKLNSSESEREANQISQRAYDKRKKEVLNNKKVLKEKFGINIQVMKKDNEIGVFYNKHSSVFFKNPKKP
ncbi:hypothetical protein BJAS_P3295 [Bathymodiolus japonicus methanotrophic gill symbiont]|uniref:hypothetical protein n=1 Tax=Bathymodiolus japonicus methanotrophic gill symbiont TaxID=113269 RepID=UPI001B52D051|nr:hypothetical protein [Bathymodiolus japonicus methanotrophic gill symbiont]GFO72795.1 hypothetical protein BJAS_P3295 [Bathymodiolus japonicus methanotrophic gill symbiont]